MKIVRILRIVQSAIQSAMFAMFVFGGVETAFASPIYSFTTFNAPGATGFGTNAFGINNRGQIVGIFYDAGNTRTHGFLDTGGSFTTIDVPGAIATTAYGINNSGQIVGFFGLDTGGSFTTIEVPGVCLCTSAQGINDNSQIVGWVGFPAAPEMAFVATPVATPEPRSLLTLATSLVALLGIPVQRKRALAENHVFLRKSPLQILEAVWLVSGITL